MAMNYALYGAYMLIDLNLNPWLHYGTERKLLIHHGFKNARLT